MEKRSRKIARYIQRFVFLRNQPMVTKLFIFSALLVVVPMLIISYISYNKSFKVLEDEERHSSLQIIDQVKTHIEYYVQDFEIDTLKVLNNPLMVDLLRMQTVEEIEQSHIRMALSGLLKNAAYSRADISSFTIILDGLLVVDTAEGGGLYPATELNKEYWYSKVPQNGDPIVISRIITTKMGEEPVISVAKRLISPYTLKPIGMIITDVNYKRIQEIAEKVTIGRTGHLSILDSQGHYVYNRDWSEIGKFSPYGRQMGDGGSGSFVLEEEKDFLTYSSSPLLGWTLVISVPYHELTQGSNYIGITILITVSITLAVAYLLGIDFAASIVTPIRRLQHFVKMAETGDFSGRVVVDSLDEIGLLSHGFNKMAERVAFLLEEVYFSKLKETELELRHKETELKALQSQMNPHFIYNSLDTIRGMALEQDMDDIATMASSLAGLLRYNLKSDAHTVTLQQEVAFCKVYLQVQKYRFEDRLAYEFNIPDWATRQSVAKFSLQPLVENCVIHSIETGIERVTLRITAERDGQAFNIVLSDNGAGIPPETLKRIQDDLKQRDVLSGGHSIGIVNVHKRINYIYGEAFGITIYSQPNHGTTVTIRLPYQSMELEGRQEHEQYTDRRRREMGAEGA